MLTLPLLLLATVIKFFCLREVSNVSHFILVSKIFSKFLANSSFVFARDINAQLTKVDHLHMPFL